MRQRMQRQCCTRGRPRPAHPRQLAGVRLRDAPARRFVCARCRAPVLVCSHCDRGQVYCAAGCAATARRLSQRDAGRRYQDSLPGRFHHAARTQRWRVRQAALATSTSMLAATSIEPSTAQSVTHQGSPLGASDAVLAAPSSMPAAAATPASAPHDQPCSRTVTTSSAATLATSASSAVGGPAPITLPTWRCYWCHTPCAARVRLDFLRHSRPARHARRKEEPGHGHSP